MVVSGKQLAIILSLAFVLAVLGYILQSAPANYLCGDGTRVISSDLCGSNVNSTDNTNSNSSLNNQTQLPPSNNQALPPRNNLPQNEEQPSPPNNQNQLPLPNNQNSSSMPGNSNQSSGLTAVPDYLNICLLNTENSSKCKECCDCNGNSGNDRKSCRDTCAIYDFSNSSDFISVNTTTELGSNGDFSIATDSATVQICKEYCDGSPDLLCGDRKYCRDACNAKFENFGNTLPQNSSQSPPPPQGGN